MPPASLRGSVRFRFSEKKMKNAGVIHALAYPRHEHTHLHIQTRGVRLWGWVGHLEPLITSFHCSYQPLPSGIFFRSMSTLDFPEWPALGGRGSLGLESRGQA